MRIAFFSPMPPARSGIADYSAALVNELNRIADVAVFASEPRTFDPDAFDVILCQIGNNSEHIFAYEAAMRHAGVVVIHEANLHHLMADMTIRRGNWDAYIRECEFEGGQSARCFAEERVRSLKRGPDYDGVPMLRRVTSTCQGVIAHSEFVAREVRATGYAGPLAVIPHGAWVGSGETPPDRAATRRRLGVLDLTPLIGAFGFLKPYKRLGETLRAVRRLIRIDDRVRMILAGEAHPDFPVEQRIAALGLSSHVRMLGYTPERDFAAYIQACDIVVNLRCPTVGESSGSLLRAFSAGRPALVSDVGAFAELRDDICLKVPVGEGEEDVIFEFLHLLVSKPEFAREIGQRARDWVERECSWSIVARKYADFLSTVAAARV